MIGIVNNGGTLSGTTIGTGPGTATISGGMISGTTQANGAAISGATNLGTLTASTNASTWNGGTNSGTLEGSGGMLTIAGTVSNGPLGTLQNVSLTGVTLIGGTLAGTDFATGADTLENLINSGTTTISSGTTTLTGTISNTGSFNVAGGTLDLLGVTISGGTISTSGGAVVSHGTVLLDTTLDPGAFQLTVENGSTITSNNNWDITPTNTVEVGGGGVLSAGGGNIINNGGTLSVDAGGEADGGIYTQENSGILNLNGTLDVSVANLLGGAVTGTGDFGASTIVNNGTSSGTGVTLYVAGTGSVGTWNIGEYSDQGNGVIFFDVNSVSTHDLLDVYGNVTLNGGTLSLAGFDYSGYGGARIDLIYITGTGSVTGTFNALSLPGPWTLVYGSKDVYLQDTDPAPEPAPYWLIGGAVIALGLFGRRRFARRGVSV